MSADRPLVALVVEDEAVLLMDIADGLRDAGWEVIESRTGEGALEIFKAEPYVDLLLTDIRLGGYLSGWEVADAARLRRPEIPIVYTSGNTVDRTRKLQGSVFFDKPYDLAEVVAACRNLCSG